MPNAEHGTLVSHPAVSWLYKRTSDGMHRQSTTPVQNIRCLSGGGPRHDQACCSPRDEEGLYTGSRCAVIGNDRRSATTLGRHVQCRLNRAGSATYISELVCFVDGPGWRFTIAICQYPLSAPRVLVFGNHPDVAKLSKTHRYLPLLARACGAKSPNRCCLCTKQRDTASLVSIPDEVQSTADRVFSFPS